MSSEFLFNLKLIKTAKLILVIIFLLFGSQSFAQTQKETNWREDIRFLQEKLPESHINFFSVKSRREFNESLKNISDSVGGLSDLSIAIKLQQLIASFGDSHSGANWFKLADLSKTIPADFYWFEDGIYFMQTLKENEILLGSRLLSINNVSLNIIIDSLSTLITVDNEATTKKSIPKLLTSYQLLDYFKFANDDYVIVDAVNPETNDTIKSYKIDISENKNTQNDYISLRRKQESLSYQNAEKMFASVYLPYEYIYYIQYNKCWSKELELKYNNGIYAEKMMMISEFEEKVLRDIEKEKITKIIFDVRRNTGGNSAQGTEFIEKIYNISKVLNNTEVFVLIGRSTYSSAIINAMDFKKYENAIFVGEETSGKPNHFGEVKTFSLPNSGLIISYSTKFFRRLPTDTNTLRPDIYKTTTITDYKNGIDPSIEFVKKLE